MNISDATMLAARRLYVASTVVLTLFTAFAVAGVALGVALAVVDHGSQRSGGVVLAVASAATWLLSILPYLAAQAIARYIEFRVIDADVE